MDGTCSCIPVAEARRHNSIDICGAHRARLGNDGDRKPISPIIRALGSSPNSPFHTVPFALGARQRSWNSSRGVHLARDCRAVPPRPPFPTAMRETTGGNDKSYGSVVVKASTHFGSFFSELAGQLGVRPGNVLPQFTERTEETFPPVDPLAEAEDVHCLSFFILRHILLDPPRHAYLRFSLFLTGVRRSKGATPTSRRRDGIPEHRLNFVATRSAIEFGNSPLVQHHLKVLTGGGKASVSPVRLQVRGRRSLCRLPLPPGFRPVARALK